MIQYPRKAEPVLVPPPEVVTLDKWFMPTSQPVLPRVRVAHSLFHTSLEPSLTVIVPDLSWYRPTSQPVLPKVRGLQGVFAKSVSEDPEQVLLDKWFAPPSQPVLPRVRGLQGQSSRPIEPPPPPEGLITLDKWFAPTSQPVLPRVRVTHSFVTAGPEITLVVPFPFPGPSQPVLPRIDTRSFQFQSAWAYPGPDTQEPFLASDAVALFVSLTVGDAVTFLDTPIWNASFSPMDSWTVAEDTRQDFFTADHFYLTDQAGISQSVTETATTSDTAATLLMIVLADNASFVEATVSSGDLTAPEVIVTADILALTLAVSEFVAMVDVALPTTTITVPDAVALADTLALAAAFVAPQAVSVADTGVLLASVSTAETSSFTDVAVLGAAFTAGEAVSFNEVVTLVTVVTSLDFLVAADPAAFPVGALSAADSFSGVEAGSLAASLPTAEAGSFTDVGMTSRAASAADTTLVTGVGSLAATITASQAAGTTAVGVVGIGAADAVMMATGLALTIGVVDTATATSTEVLAALVSAADFWFHVDAAVASPPAGPAIEGGAGSSTVAGSRATESVAGHVDRPEG